MGTSHRKKRLRAAAERVHNALVCLGHTPQIYGNDPKWVQCTVCGFKVRANRPEVLPTCATWNALDSNWVTYMYIGNIP